MSIFEREMRCLTRVRGREGRGEERERGDIGAGREEVFAGSQAAVPAGSKMSHQTGRPPRDELTHATPFPSSACSPSRHTAATPPRHSCRCHLNICPSVSGTGWWWQ